MWTRLLACALVGSVSVACGGGSDVAGSPTATPDDSGASPDAGTPQDSGGTILDATATAAADSMVDAGAAGTAQCRWPGPGYLAPSTVGRYLVSCRVAPVDGGSVYRCVSNDPNTCYGVGVSANAPDLVDCSDQCDPDEYAVSLQDPPRMSMADPFAFLAGLGCRSLGAASTPGLPAVRNFYCCPCEAADAGTDADAAAISIWQPFLLDATVTVADAVPMGCEPGMACTTDSDCACLDVGRCNDAGECASVPVPRCAQGRCE